MEGVVGVELAVHRGSGEVALMGGHRTTGDGERHLSRGLGDKEDQVGVMVRGGTLRERRANDIGTQMLK